MKQFGKKFSLSTKVKIAGDGSFYKIASFDNDRKLIKIKGLLGSFQRGHILKYTNKFE